MLCDPEPETAPIVRLPDEVLALLFHFLGSKTLLMAVPAVSARVRGQAGGSVLAPSRRSASASWAAALRTGAGGWKERVLRGGRGDVSTMHPLDLVLA